MPILLDKDFSNKLLLDLNDDQKRAVIYNDGPLLVLAGAGSGKTRVLTYRAAWFIAKKIIPAREVLLLTFTNKAAGEMKERITKLVKERPGFAGTFHSFCAHMLRIDGDKIDIPDNFVIYDTQDTKDAIKEILLELDQTSDFRNAGMYASQISESKNNMVNPLGFAEIARGEWQKKVFKVYQRYEKYLEKVGALDFDDLLLKAVKLLGESKEAASKWRKRMGHVFVDEWQDTNKIQYKLTQLMVGSGGEITVVGDASQSIYSWRGADFRNIDYLMRDFPHIKVVNLEQNYRSSQNILSAANSVISKNASHPTLKLWTDNSGGEKIKVYQAVSGNNEAKFVVTEIQQLSNLRNLNRGEKLSYPTQFSFGDIAVLYRTNAQSRILEEVLLHAGIPYVLVGGIRFYERREIKDIISYLRLLVNPNDMISKRRVIKLGKRRFEKFKVLARKLRSKYTKSFNKITSLSLMDMILDKTDYLKKYQRETEENLMRLENIKELRSVAMEFPRIIGFLENIALVELEWESKESERSKSNSIGKVSLMTLHAAKGLEFPVIFIVGMEEGLFPHSRSLFDVNQIEEERRLAYVGMTRAKEILYLTFADRRLYFGQQASNPPSRFIMEIPEGLLDVLNGDLNFSSLEVNNW
jgi:DNA helicase-2/ATP-dependent DNA helicase PcrA